MPRKARTVELQPAVLEILERLARARTAPQSVVERATMVVLAAAGATDVEVARQLGVDQQRPRRWRGRWLEAAPALSEAVALGANHRDLEARIIRALSDAPRPGSPPKFSAEQVAQLIALACERPADSGLPVNRWTPAELAKEAVKRGIVESISPRHLDRLLKRG